jgi:hypothetical protein
MKKYLILFIIFIQVSNAQTINKYKYAIVPNKFSFSKVENQHNLNVLSKLMLKKYGLIAYTEADTIPSFITSNPCEVLYLDVEATNTMFSTKTKVLLKDCGKKIVAESGVGISKEKEYYTAYNEALRMAFDNFSALKMYQYTPSENQTKVSQSVHTTEQKEVVVMNTKLQKVMYGQNFKILDYNGVVLLSCYKTSLENVYLADKNGEKGLFYSQNSQWFFEYYQNEKRVVEQYNLE